MQNKQTNKKSCITGQCKIGMGDWLADHFQAILLLLFKLNVTQAALSKYYLKIN